MLVHLILIFGVQAVLTQSVSSQCIGRTAAGPKVNRPSALNLCATPATTTTPTGPSSCEHSSSAFNTEAPITTSILPVTSVSAIPLESIAVTSENSYEGSLTVSGELPFLGTVNLDGELPSAGKGAVKHAYGGPAKLTKVNLVPGSTNTRFNSAAAFDTGYKSARNPKTGVYPEVGNGAATARSGRNRYPDILGNADAVRFGTANTARHGHIKTSLGEIVSAKFSAHGFARDGFVGSAPAEYSGTLGLGYDRKGACIRSTDLGNAVQGFGSYSTSGEGNVKVAGQLPVSGETVLTGQMPIAGAVVFQGAVPSRGTVSIKAFCSGRCEAPY